MRRGEIRLVDLDPTVGSEASKVRPAVIVSNDGANTAAGRTGHGVVTVVPVTSNTERVSLRGPAPGDGLLDTALQLAGSFSVTAAAGCRRR